VVTVLGPVRVIDEEDTLDIATPAAAIVAVAPSGTATQLYVLVEVKGGLNPVIVTWDGGYCHYCR